MKVYSLVAVVPFSPVDVDLNVLARGEWDSLRDRMRVWFLPSESEGGDPSCYVMIRKLDTSQGILVCAHIVMNLGFSQKQDGSYFTIGILSNDDVRARATLGVFVGVPPIFHGRSEIRLKEAKWRTDAAAVMRFAANVHSAISSSNPVTSGETQGIRFELPKELSSLGRMDSWWEGDSA